MAKIDIIKENLQKNIDILCCPLCKNKLDVKNGSLVCTKRHSFDISSKGYVNFLSGIKMAYSKELFNSRRKVSEYGFFNELISEIADIIKSGHYILDAGCGEGSHLNGLIPRLSGNYTGIGIDLAKEGIALCEKKSPNIWLVADLANMPITGNSIDYLLNILSPANYSEFKRVLNKDGIIIKVAPGHEHLKELRNFFYSGLKEYDDSKVAGHFEENICLAGQKNVKYVFKAQSVLEEIINMTPLSRNISEQKKADFIQSGIKEITADFKILWGCMQ